MGAEVLVLVTCTNRKTVPPAAALRLRAVPGRTIAARAAAWRERLADAPGQAVPAETLYAGDHWHVTRSLDAIAQRRSLALRTFVCSAGYGLVHAGALVHSYAATFSAGAPDSVARGLRNGEAAAARRTWWRELSEWEGPSPGEPRSIADLVRVHDTSAVLVAVSPPYLDAITDDMAEAISSISPQRVAIFSAGTASHPLFGQNLIPCDARLQRPLGGARASLNVRCLRHAFERLPVDKLTVPDLRRYFTRLLARQPDLEAPKRAAQSDGEVIAFIRDQLASDPTARPTRLVKALRASGRACEQSRFSALFRQITGEVGHG